MPPPSAEQVADDKAKLKELENVKRTITVHERNAGIYGFSMLGAIGLVIAFMLMFQLEKNFGILAFLSFVAGLSALLCSIAYGYKFMDSIYTKEKDAFKLKIKYDDIIARQQGFPESYKMQKPDAEQIAADKMKLKELEGIKSNMNMHARNAGTFGFFLLAIVGIAIMFSIAGKSGMLRNEDDTFVPGLIIVLGIILIVCSTVYGDRFMHANYNKNRTNFKAKHNFDEIESRMAAYPDLYK